MATPNHAFEAFDGASGQVCTAMVMRDGGGDQCGLTAEEHLQGFVQRWICGIDSNALEIDDEPVGYDAFGAPLYAHQVGPLGDE